MPDLVLDLPELPFPLTASGPPGDWAHREGVLSVTAAAGQDRFVRPGGSGRPPRDAPRLLGVPDGDFRLSARVRPDLAAPGDAGGLYLETADGRWAKLCLEQSPLRPTVVSVVTRDVSDDANSYRTQEACHWLRVSRLGDAFAFHASHDGTEWTFVRLFALGDGALARRAAVGFMPQSPDGTGCRVRYDHLALRPGAPASLRDGS